MSDDPAIVPRVPTPPTDTSNVPQAPPSNVRHDPPSVWMPRTEHPPPAPPEPPPEPTHKDRP